MALIEVKDLALGYEGRVIVEDLNFRVEAGDYLCILGENGVGKSTLMKALLGLNRPISGEIRYGEGLASNEIGYLPQQTQVQKDFPASVEEIVLSGAIGRKGSRPFYSKEDREGARICMEHMNIAHMADRCFRELSGGQQQRVLLARALNSTGKIIFMDEPTAGLDSTMTADMYGAIKEINDDGITIVMISHDLDEALKYADHILNIGKANFFGPTDEFVTDRVGATIVAEAESDVEAKSVADVDADTKAKSEAGAEEETETEARVSAAISEKEAK